MSEQQLMRSILIPQLLKSPQQTATVEVKDYLPDLETLTPVQGELRVTHHGNYIEVTATVEAIVTLTCNRCLKQYNHRLSINPTELIWLQDPEAIGSLPLEREITMDELVETLPPNGYFQPDEWLYEQFCLAIPQRTLCDEQCQGIQVSASQPQSSPKTDRRWASLEAFKQQISNN